MDGSDETKNEDDHGDDNDITLPQNDTQMYSITIFTYLTKI